MYENTKYKFKSRFFVSNYKIKMHKLVLHVKIQDTRAFEEKKTYADTGGSFENTYANANTGGALENTNTNTGGPFENTNTNANTGGACGDQRRPSSRPVAKGDGCRGRGGQGGSS